MKKIIVLLLLNIFYTYLGWAQKKFETTIGVSYNISAYKSYPSPNYSNYLENQSTNNNGFGFTIKEEFYLSKLISAQTGLELINTNIAFNNFTLSQFGSGTYRHSIKIYELEIPVNIKLNCNIYKSLKGYMYGGVAIRTIPYSSVKINTLSETEVFNGKADTRIFDGRYIPNIGAGIDFPIKERKISLFGEAVFKYLSKRYFYSGDDKNDWITDTLIPSKHFICISIGVKF